uniref:Uncharacterized protein n=1 Tax=viral metagenome TaxID=1070528 RepID=A0A6H1ZRB7_9ZZZZ
MRINKVDLDELNQVITAMQSVPVMLITYEERRTGITYPQKKFMDKQDEIMDKYNLKEGDSISLSTGEITVAPIS